MQNLFLATFLSRPKMLGALLISAMICVLAVSSCAPGGGTAEQPRPVRCTGWMERHAYSDDAQCYRFQAPDLDLVQAAREFVAAFPLIADGSHAVKYELCVGGDVVGTDHGASLCLFGISPVAGSGSGDEWSITIALPTEVIGDSEQYTYILDGGKLGDIELVVVVDRIPPVPKE